MIDIYNGFMHWVWAKDNDGWPHYWDLVVMPGFIIALASIPIGVWHASDRWKNKQDRYRSSAPFMVCLAGGFRGATLVAIVMLLWPWLVIALGPVAVLGLIGLMVWSWTDLIPSKEERVAKAQAKVVELRGKAS